MTPEAQRIAIAEACGWEKRLSKAKSEYRWYDPNDGHNYLRPPGYLNDLNAMHEAEQFLSRTYGMRSVRNHHRDYLLRLIQLLNPGEKLWDNGTFLGDWAHVIKTAEATAAQRAEAFLRTIGKWDDNE